MALIKDIDSEYGVPAGYWKIISYSSILDNDKGRIILAGYKNKAARAAKMKMLKMVEYISDAEINSKSDMYAFAKSQPEFKD